MNTLDDFDLAAFLAERPALKFAALARELEVDEANLRKIVQRERNIPRAKRGIFTAVLNKYGASIQPHHSSLLPHL